MPAKALAVFNATRERAETLWKLTLPAAAGRPPKKKDQEDMLRASLMLMVAAVDAFFHDKILESLTPFLTKKRGKNLPGSLLEIFRKDVGIEKLMPLLYQERPHRHLHTIIKRILGDRTFQKPGKIESALGLVGADSDFWFKTARKMGYGASREGIKKRLGQYVERRDKIAHEADRARGGKLIPINRKYVEDCIRFITRFIKAADKVISEGIESAA